MYLILGVFTIFIWYLEDKDNKCPTFHSSSEECENGGGMSFSGTKPNDIDTCKELIEKIYKGAGAEQASIKWRRSFILAVSIMGAMWILIGTPGRLPEWRVFYLSVIIAYCIIFGNFNYYSYHVFGKAGRWMRDSIEGLKSKGCVR